MAWVTRDRPPPVARLPRGGRLSAAVLLQQLVADLPRRLVLRPVRDAGSAQPPLVAVGRGAVLHPLAVPADASAASSSIHEAPSPGGTRVRTRRRDRSGSALVSAILMAILYKPGHRPLAGLLRDRHAGARSCCSARRWRWSGRAAACAANIAAAGAADDRRRRASLGLARDRADVLAVERVLAVPLPRRLPAALDRDRARRRGDGAPGLAARPDRRLPADALDRRALLRHLPLALPDHRPDHPRGAPRGAGPPAGDPPGRRDVRGRGALVEVRREPDPPRRPRARLRTVAGGRAGGASASRAAAGPALGPRRVVLLVALAGFAGVGARARTTADAPGNITVAETIDGGRRPARSTRTARPATRSSTSATRPPRGSSPTEYLPDPKRPDRRPVRAASARPPSTSRSPARARSTRRSRVSRTPRTSPRRGRTQGFDGCWVLALGTNEAANVSAGSTVTLDERIDTMMHVADGDPVLWVNVKSLVTDGPYAATNMEEWDEALLDACEPLPEHADLRLGRRRQGRLVHRGRHPLHDAEGYARPRPAASPTPCSRPSPPAARSTSPRARLHRQPGTRRRRAEPTDGDRRRRRRPTSPRLPSHLLEVRPAVVEAERGLRACRRGPSPCRPTADQPRVSIRGRVAALGDLDPRSLPVDVGAEPGVHLRLREAEASSGAGGRVVVGVLDALQIGSVGARRGSRDSVRPPEAEK